MQKNFLSTHYYFDDDTHSMDAFILNKCDKETLQLILHIAEILKIKNKLQLEKLANKLPNKESGLVEWYQTLLHEDKVATAAFFVDIINFYLTVPAKKSSSNKEELTNKKSEGDSEERVLEITEMRETLHQGLEALNDKYKDALNPDLLKDKKFISLKKHCLKLLQSDKKLRRKQSSFYRNIINCNKVQSVGFTSYDKQQVAIAEEQLVERKDFKKFILETNEDIELIENVKIDIVSPNLLPINKRWRGYLVDEDTYMQFSMLDKDFKKDIENKVINFANGSTINAVLSVTTKYDEFGDETSKKYEVETVLKYTIDNASVETKQGKKHKFNKKNLEKQQSLDF